jgi:hypothetical protein
MPALLPVPGVARAAIVGTAAGGTIVNVLHFKLRGDNFGPWTIPEVQGLSDRIASQWVTNVLPLLSAAYAATNVTVTDLTDELGNVASTPIVGSGSAGASSHPMQVACCASWKIARHYRGGHPRTYLGPMATSKTDTSRTFSAVYVTDVATRLAAFRTGMITAPAPAPAVDLVCVHRYRNGAVLTPPLTSIVQDVQVDTRIDTQRRRLGRDT